MIIPLSAEEFPIHHGTPIAIFVFGPYQRTSWWEYVELDFQAYSGTRSPKKGWIYNRYDGMVGDVP